MEVLHEFIWQYCVQRHNSIKHIVVSSKKKIVKPLKFLNYWIHQSRVRSESVEGELNVG